MATRFMYKALVTAALGVALSPLLAAATAPSPAWSNTSGSLQLDPPAAPSQCRARTTRYPDPEWPRGYYTLTYLTWADNSGNEDGFTVEEWQRNQSGDWVLRWSVNRAANATSVEVDGSGPNYKFRVKAFNGSGESAWSNWGH
jgi:hypothetical protein